MKGIDTKILGTNFRAVSSKPVSFCNETYLLTVNVPNLKLTEVSALGSLDMISLSRGQMEAVRWSKLPLSLSLPETTPAPWLEAQNAAYSTSLLQHKFGFTAAMSSEARIMLASTMYPVLGRQKIAMDQIEDIFAEEITKQLALKNLQLKDLYRLRSGKIVKSAPDLQRCDVMPNAQDIPEIPDESADETGCYVRANANGGTVLGTVRDNVEGVDYF